MGYGRAKIGEYKSPSIELLTETDTGGNGSLAVPLKSIMESAEFNALPSLSAALGQTRDGHIRAWDLGRSAHIVIAGQDGYGKTDLLRSIVIGLAYKCAPIDLRFLFIDPKRVDLSVFKNMPHSLIGEIISEPEHVRKSLKWLKGEYRRRGVYFDKYHYPNIDSYNKCMAVQLANEPRFPHIVVMISELADILSSPYADEIKDCISFITSKGASAGIHLALATTDTSDVVYSTIIKANINTRVLFRSTPSAFDILISAEYMKELKGHGNIIYSMPYELSPCELNSAYIGLTDAKAVVDYLYENNYTDYDAHLNAVLHELDDFDMLTPDKVSDPLFRPAFEYFCKKEKASIALLQRRFSIGFARATRIMDQMEECGLIGSYDGGYRARPILMTLEEFRKEYGYHDEPTEEEFGNAPSIDEFLRRAGADPDEVKASIAAAEAERAEKAEKVKKPTARKYKLPQGPLAGRMMLMSVLKHAIDKGYASTAEVQYCFGISYPMTLELFGTMQECGFIAAPTDEFKQEVLITADEFNTLFGEFTGE